MTRRKIGLALAGGGPLGAIWEIGSLTAIDEALVGLDLVDCDVFVGVSSGAVVAAGLANGLTPRVMHQTFVGDERADNPFEPDKLLQPALDEYLRRAATLPQLVAKVAKKYFEAPLSGGLLESLRQLSHVLPTGLFDNAPIGRYMSQILSAGGRTDDFRKLHRQLFIVGTDLDTSEAIAFGSHGWDDVPISRAVQASAALPGLYPPVKIHGHHFVDGALVKTLHASLALREGADLLLCVNPLVPFDTVAAAHHTHRKPISLVELGLPTVLSQTFRSIIHSRMGTAMSRYGLEYPDADILLFEPRRDDEEMFFTNIFSYAERHRLLEHAYQATRSDLRRRYDELAAVLERHGLGLDDAVLNDASRTINGSEKPLSSRNARALRRTASQLDQALDALSSSLDALTPPRPRAKRRRAATGPARVDSALPGASS